MSLSDPIPRYELTKMLGYVELDEPFEKTSTWLHKNLCTRWWHQETIPVMQACYDVIPQLSLSDAHKEFARMHFMRYIEEFKNDKYDD